MKEKKNIMRNMITIVCLLRFQKQQLWDIKFIAMQYDIKRSLHLWQYRECTFPEKKYPG